jgi:DNA-binding MarR family transcriptional regulator
LVRITDGGRAVLADRNAARARVLHERLAAMDEHDRRLLLAALPALERLTAHPNDNRNGTT